MHFSPFTSIHSAGPALCVMLAFCATYLRAQEVDLPTLPEAELPSDSFTLSEPVPITDANQNTQLLVGMEQGQLRLSFPNMPGAEAIVPVDGEDMVVSAQLPPDYNRLLNEYQLGNYGTYITGMSATAEPMAGFLAIPPAQTNFHNIFSRYYEAVVAAGRLEDAVALTFRMPWSRLPPGYDDLGERLIYRSIEDREFAQTEKLLSLFYRTLPETTFSGIAFRVADALRTEQQHGLATEVYGSLAQSEEPLLRQKSLLWAGYSRAVSGDASGARDILTQVEELDRGDENFLTYCLALGRLGYAEDNVTDGLRYLSRAMVLTAVDATFKPELYYLLSSGYWESGNQVAADRLAREFTIFYPNSPWLSKYKTEYGSDL